MSEEKRHSIIEIDNKNESKEIEERDRKTISLDKNNTLLDWYRLCKDSTNLAGNHGIIRQISMDELAIHNKEEDCWISVYDRVYNITPYLKYHPGGVDSIMKGAGKDATQLFIEVFNILVLPNDFYVWY